MNDLSIPANKGFTRGRVLGDLSLYVEIRFEDCDYVSQEAILEKNNISIQLQCPSLQRRTHPLQRVKISSNVHVQLQA